MNFNFGLPADPLQVPNPVEKTKEGTARSFDQQNRLHSNKLTHRVPKATGRASERSRSFHAPPGWHRNVLWQRPAVETVEKWKPREVEAETTFDQLLDAPS